MNTAADSTLTTRLLIIAGIALGMLIPLFMVQDVVDERLQTHNGVLADIAGVWGERQLLQGPVLIVPFTEKQVVDEQSTDKNGMAHTLSTTHFVRRSAVFLPDDLAIHIGLAEQYRSRGIYDSLVYTMDADVQGSFALTPINALSERVQTVHWDAAYLAVGLTDTRAINKVTPLQWEGKEYRFDPGTAMGKAMPTGFHAAPAGLSADKSRYRFQFAVNANGSSALRFTAFGTSTKVDMHSAWPHPSFQGKVLPATRAVRNDGFTAHWEIPNLARNYPQQWILEEADYDLSEFQAGVDLFEPVFLYSQITRSVKYGILFVALTFLTFLIFELTVKAKLHYVQYGLIGLALSLFFLVLLSLSEHLAFSLAYFAAATLTVLMIAAYTYGMLGSVRRAGIILGLLAGLYTLLFFLLRLEDYALLMGTALLLAVLGILMYLTQHLEMDDG
ncbi:MAG: cell envelope integrity protein CreD [Methylococcaceae bacterium]|nr:MAG: cell envelope integrity protein CreD [Methylococcaceae bacterium]